LMPYKRALSSGSIAMSDMNQRNNLKTAISVVGTGQHVTVNEVGSGFVFALAITLVEALDSSTRVNKLLLASEIRVALVAEFDVEIATTR